MSKRKDGRSRLLIREGWERHAAFFLEALPFVDFFPSVFFSVVSSLTDVATKTMRLCLVPSSDVHSSGRMNPETWTSLPFLRSSKVDASSDLRQHSQFTRADLRMDSSPLASVRLTERGKRATKLFSKLRMFALTATKPLRLKEIGRASC